MSSRGVLNTSVTGFAGRYLPVQLGATRKKKQNKQRQGEKVKKHSFLHILSMGIVCCLLKLYNK